MVAAIRKPDLIHGLLGGTQMLVIFLAICAVGEAEDVIPLTKEIQGMQENNSAHISPGMLEIAFIQAEKEQDDRMALESQFSSSDLVLPNIISVEARHQIPALVNNVTSALDKISQIFLSTTRLIKNRLNLSNEEVESTLFNVDSSEEGSETQRAKSSCMKLFQVDSCDSASEYRSIDGSCNNLKNPTWGRSVTCYGRLLPPDYSDGISLLRLSVSGDPLPNVRLITKEVHETSEMEHGNTTALFMQFGQFMNHDIAHLASSRTVVNGSMLKCCPPGVNKHPECLSIDLTMAGDDFFGHNKKTCMNFVRSAICSQNCTLGPRQQINEATAFIDASTVYGVNQNMLSALREYQGGLLKSENTSDGEYLPPSTSPTVDQCSRPKAKLLCFEAGDKRVNQHTGLTVMHTLWLREHNRLARLIQNQNPDATDEEIFQRARKIVIAVIQNVVYKEYLPLVLGTTYMDDFDLNSGNDSLYSDSEDPAILTDFSTAANRFGHTLIPGSYQNDPLYEDAIGIDDSFFEPILPEDKEIESGLSDLVQHASKLASAQITTAVTHNLYRDEYDYYGLDLSSLNLQRGRDHGLPGYTKYVKHFFHKDVKSFDELDFINETGRQKLQSLFKHVDDIDIFTGGVLEKQLSGAVVGPTFATMIGLQFRKLKFGDRFYFEHANQSGSFSAEQLAEIRNSSIAKVICANSITIQEIMPEAFLMQTETHVLKDCKDIGVINHEMF